jgi:hypothetical protein
MSKRLSIRFTQADLQRLIFPTRDALALNVAKESRDIMNPGKTILTLALLAVALFHAASASAQTTLTVGTGGTATATYGGIPANAGPFPASNFGVAASANLGGTSVDLALGGGTNFLFPAFSDGQVLLPNSSNVNVGYTPAWTGSLTSTSNFSLSATFVSNVGPFSSSDNLFSQNLNAVASGNLASGGTLAGSNASGTANGSFFNYTYSASAFVASASASINIGANYQNSLNWTPTTQYGVYSWLSTTQNQGPSSTPAFTSVSSGGLNYTVQDFGSFTPGQQLYLNFEPGVTLGMTVTPSSTLSAPITGNLSAEAFGDTLINYTFPIATVFTLPVNYNEWDVNGQWNSSYAYSIPVIEENGQSTAGGCLDPMVNCVEYIVDGNPFSFLTNSFPNSGPSSLTNGFASGSWNPILNGGAILPPACDPASGVCYSSDDPNMPVGSATVTSSVTEVIATPEPGTLPLFVAGLAGMVFVGWRKHGFALGKIGQA